MSESEEDRVEFSVQGYVDPADVPSWTRRPPKWQELMDIVGKLEPGQTVVIEFPTKSAANRGRNVVRDELNSEIGRAAIRTRLVQQQIGEDVKHRVYFTRLLPIDYEETDN